ncbi:carboxylesterase family protein [Microbacterium resistens]
MMLPVRVHRGIPYAQAERFGRPAPVPAGPPIPGGISVEAPQHPSRLALVMGTAAPLEQQEDCLELTIFAPVAVDPTPLPVLVWLHGGAYLTGSGGWNLYDATALAARGPMVVVAVSHRLGLLGYAPVPGISAGNRGLADQIAALGWVQRHIASYGGDPRRVTVAGQSAGAQAIVAMLGIDGTRGLFRRAVVQSAPIGLGFHSAADAARVAATVAANAGTDLTTCSVEDVLATQERAAGALAGAGLLRAAPPFQPVWGVDPLPEPEVWQQAVDARIPDVELLIGTTADEAAAFVANPHDPGSEEADAANRLRQMMTQTVFAQGATELADRWSENGGRAHLYRFERHGDANPLGACHCFELPLLFGAPEDWQDAPMLAGIPPQRTAEARASVQTRWAGFVRDGDPGWDAHAVGRPPQAL